MINGLKICAALLGVVAMFASVEFSTCSILQTASAQAPSVATGFSVADPIVSTVYGVDAEIGGPVGEGCQSCQAAPAPVVESCQSCQAVAAPSLGQNKADCDCQYCTLKTKKIEVDKKRFKVEQKEVCIPAVRLPWKRCCPPKKSRVRTVNVLKTEKYKGETCEYKWSVHEPEEYKEPEPADPMVVYEPEQSGPEATSIYPDPSADLNGVLELSDPAEAIGEIPRPPLEK